MLMLCYWLVFRKWFFGHFIAFFIHPTDLAGRITDHECVCRHIFGDHGACAYHAILAQFVAANDGGVRSDGYASTENRLSVFVLSADGGTRVDDVRKDHGRAKKNIVLTNHTSIDGNIVLDFAVTAEFDVGRDNHVLAYITVFTDLAAGHNVAEMPYFGAFADLAVVINVG